MADKYSLGDYNFELDPELMKLAEQKAMLEQPDMAQTDSGVPMSDVASPDILKQRIRANLLEKMGQSEDPTLEAIKGKLQERIEGYDPEKLESEKQKELADTEISGWRKGLGILGAALQAGGGMKPTIIDFEGKEAKARKGVEEKYNKKEKQFMADTKILQDFKNMDVQEKLRELQSANMLMAMDQKELDMKLKRSMLGSDEQMNDPASMQSQQAKLLFKEMTGKEAPEGSTALSLYPVTKDASSYYKSKAQALIDYTKEMRGEKRALAKEKRAAEAEKLKPTEGEKVMDREFSKKYSEYLQNRGDIDINRKKLQGVVDAIDKDKLDTGWYTGLKAGLGEKVGYKTEAMEAKDEVRSAIQGMLRPILGGQFAEKEGERIINVAFDPSRSEEANKKALKDEILKLDNRVESFKQQADYFRENRTLKGFEPGSLPSSSVSEEIRTKMVDGKPVRFKKVSGGWQRID